MSNLRRAWFSLQLWRKASIVLLWTYSGTPSVAASLVVFMERTEQSRPRGRWHFEQFSSENFFFKWVFLKCTTFKQNKDLQKTSVLVQVFFMLKIPSIFAQPATGTAWAECLSPSLNSDWTCKQDFSGFVSRTETQYFSLDEDPRLGAGNIAQRQRLV